jgi:L-threonylcarbamoyladenylate synthase
LTVVLPKSPMVPDIVTSSLPTVAIRVPNHPLALELIRESGRPIAAPSANLFGQVSPTMAEHVRQSFGGKIGMILDGGPCRVGVESTVISFVDKEPVLLRPGGAPLEEIQSLIGPVRVAAQAAGKPPLARGRQAEGRALGVPGQGAQPQNGPGLMAPGQLESHYAPRTPLVFGGSLESLPKDKRIGWLGLERPADPSPFAALEVLSEHQDLREAAANLFAAIRRLDEKNLDVIWALPVPDQGLGRAINDRLAKASQK